MQTSLPACFRQALSHSAFLAIGVLLFSLSSGQLAASEALKSFDLPADQAERSLKRFSEQSGHEVLFPTETVSNVRTNAVRGRLVPRVALERMLANTELLAQLDEQTGAFAVRRRQSSAEPTQNPPAGQNAAVQSGAGAQPGAARSAQVAGEVIQLSPFTVDATEDRGYQATNSISATRLNAPVYELPISVNIATEEFIRDLGTSDLQATMSYITNVDQSFAPNATGQFNMRGSAMSNRGVFQNSRPTSHSVADNYNIARVEVVKGPASPITGVSTPVGMINYFIKKPNLKESFSQWDIKVGDDDFYRTSLDVNQPFELFGRSHGVRLMAVHEDSKSFIPFVSKKHKGVTMTNFFRLADTVTLDTYVEYLEIDRSQSALLPEASIGHPGAFAPFGSGGWSTSMRTATGGIIPAPPQNIGGQTVTNGMFVQDVYDIVKMAGISGPDNFQNFRTFAFDASLVWQPTPRFSIEAFYSAGNEFKDDLRKEGTGTIHYTGVSVVGGQAVFNPAGGRYFQRHQWIHFPQPAVWRNYARLAGFYDLQLPWMRQQFRFGADSSWMTGRQQDQSRPALGGMRNQILQLDTYLDDLSRESLSLQRWYDAGAVMTPIQHTWLPDEFADAVYATAQGSYWNNRIRSVLGVRRDKLRIRSYRIYTVPQGGSLRDDPKTKNTDTRYTYDSPILSLSVEPIKGLSLYYNRAESVSFTQAGGPILIYNGTVNDNPQTAVAEGRFNPDNAVGPPPPPETGEGEEYGVKLSLLGGRLSASLSRYTNERVNIRTGWPATYIRDLFGPTHPLSSQQFTALGVVQEAKGWELEIQASPTENLTFSIGYAEPEVEFTVNPINPNSVGQNSAGVFKGTMNGIARYSFTKGSLNGAYVGTSFQYRGAWLESNNFGGVFLPSYTVWNPFVGYDWRPRDRWQTGVRLDARNVFDKQYATRHIVGDPFAVFFSAHLRFR